MAFLSNHNRLCQSNYSNYQPGSLLALRENLWDSSVLDPPLPPPASKAQTKTWLQFCRGKTSHLITRAEKMGLPLIWHLVIFVWERFLPCNFSSDKSGANLWQNHSPWRPAGVFVPHTHQHHTGLESEGVGVQLTDCPPPSSEVQCIIRAGGHLDKVVRWAEGIWWLVRLRQFVLFAGIQKEWLCIVLSIPHLWIWKPCQAHFSQFGGYQIFHKILAPDLERSCLKHELVRHLYWWTMGWTCLNVTNNIRSHSL